MSTRETLGALRMALEMIRDISGEEHIKRISATALDALAKGEADDADRCASDAMRKRNSRIPDGLRLAVLHRDGLTCGICHAPVAPEDVHIDHIQAASRGGQTVYENLRVTHSTCNIRKGDR